MSTSDNTTAPKHNGMSISDAIDKIIDDVARVYQNKTDELSRIYQKRIDELERELKAAFQTLTAAVAARNAALQDRDAAVAARDEARRELEAREKTASCVLCKGNIIDFGNNPDPLCTTGSCCDACNVTKVIPARMAAQQQ